MRKKLFWVGLVLILATALGFALMTTQRRSDEFGKSASLVTSSQQYTLEVVATAKDKSRGLSGRPSLAQNQGMLFVYSQEAVRCFWMKDMNFPLDIIWLNARREVVHIEQNLSPSTYPDSFCSTQDAKYVIELNAGETARAGIVQGMILSF